MCRVERAIPVEEPGWRTEGPPTSSCLRAWIFWGEPLYPSLLVSWDEGKLTETRCQSGSLTLIGRESANKEVRLPETMILEIPLSPPPPSRLERVRPGGCKREVGVEGP